MAGVPVCVLGVLSGDVVLYWTGRRWGERVLGWRLVRWVLTAHRAEWLTEAYRQHAMKTVAMARHVAGLRAAACLTAGMARVPFWKFILADAGAAAVSVPFVFALAYFFTTRSGRSWPTSTGWSAGWPSPRSSGLTGGVVVFVMRSNRRVSKAP